MKKILKIFLLIFLSGCGHQPIFFQTNLEDLQFAKINLSGDKEINKKIIDSLNFKEQKNIDKTKELFLDANYVIYETSKDSKGLVVSYRSEVVIDFIIKNKDKVIKQKKFNQSYEYNNFENSFTLSQFQDKIKNNLTNKIIEEIILHINT